MSTSTKQRARKSNRQQAQRRRGRTRKTPVVWLGLAAVVALAAVLAVVTGGGEDTEAAAVEVQGVSLPRLTETGGDVAVSMVAPALRGTGIGGGSVSIEPGGDPMVVLFLAHWCPVCQDEVPKVQAWIDAGGQPAGVDLVAVVTDTDRNRPNHPPSSWLQEQGWTVPTMLDDRGSPAAQAYGLRAFPFWVFVDADGTVAGRHAGALPVDAIEGIMAELDERRDG